MKRIPREGGKRHQKREHFSKRIKRFLGSTRGAVGVCITNIVGRGGEENPQRREEGVLERRKFY